MSLSLGNAPLAGVPLLASGNVSADLGGGCCVFVIMPAVQAIICWLTADAYKHIPQRYRFLEPNMTWLLMVPLFNLYWNFKVFLGLAESFQAYFYSHGIAEVEDCGERLARWYCICCLLSCALCFLGVPWIASLILLILFLIKADELKKRIAAAVPAR
jgi:hypothetical protein